MILKKELIKLAVEATDSEEALRTVAQGFVDNGYAKDTYPSLSVSASLQRDFLRLLLILPFRIVIANT